MKKSNVFYVYVLFDAFAVPRYVGKGKGNRWNDHEKNKSTYNKRLCRHVSKTMSILGSIPKIKIRENLAEADALKIEITLIKAIGRGRNGPLCNQTDGGEGLSGHSFSKRTRAILSKNTKQRMSLIPADERKRLSMNAAKAVKRFQWINDGETNKRIIPGEPLPDDWNSGRLITFNTIAPDICKGTIWINDGQRTRRHVAGHPVPPGWMIGRRITPIEKRLCKCGCGNVVRGRHSEWARGHAIRRKSHQEKTLQGRKAKIDFSNIDHSSANNAASPTQTSLPALPAST